MNEKMHKDPSKTNKQTGKISIKTTQKVGNGTVTGSQLKYSDNVYYQVGTHGDYIQEQGG